MWASELWIIEILYPITLYLYVCIRLCSLFFVHGVVYNIGNTSLYTDQHTDCMLQSGALDSGASLCDALGEGGNSFQAKMQWRCSPSRLDRCQCHKMWQVVSCPNSDWYWIQYIPFWVQFRFLQAYFFNFSLAQEISGVQIQYVQSFSTKLQEENRKDTHLHCSVDKTLLTSCRKNFAKQVLKQWQQLEALCTTSGHGGVSVSTITS